MNETLAQLGALRTLESNRLARLDRLRSRRSFDPVETETPVEAGDAVARTRGPQSIETHFTVTRSLLIPLIRGAILVAAGLPLLGRVQASVVSILVAAVPVVIGVAARPVVENAMAGLVISGSKLINLGDGCRVPSPPTPQ